MNSRHDCCRITSAGKDYQDQVVFDFHQREKHISKVCTVNNIKLQNSISVSENDFSDFCIFLGFCSLCNECSNKNIIMKKGEAPVVSSEESLQHNSHTSSFLNLIAELHDQEAVALCDIEINFKSSFFDILKKNPPRPNYLFQDPLSLSCTLLPISKSKATVWITVKDADSLFRSLSKPSIIRAGQESNEIIGSIADENSFMSSSQDSTSTLSTVTGIGASSRIPATTTVISSLSTHNTRGKKAFAQSMQGSSNSSNRKKRDAQFRASIRNPITTEPLIADEILGEIPKNKNHEMPNQSQGNGEIASIAEARAALHVPWISHLITKDNISTNTSSTTIAKILVDDNNYEHTTTGCRSGAGAECHDGHIYTNSIPETIIKDTTGYDDSVDHVNNSTSTTTVLSIEFQRNQELEDALLKDIDKMISESTLPTDIKYYINECIRISSHPPLTTAIHLTTILVSLTLSTNPIQILEGGSLSITDSLAPDTAIVIDTLSKKKSEKSLRTKSNKRKYPLVSDTYTDNNSNNIHNLEQIHILCTQIRSLITKSKASSLTIELIIAASCILQLLLPLEIETILNNNKSTNGEGEAEKGLVASIHNKKKSKPHGGKRSSSSSQIESLFTSKSTLKSLRIAKDKLVLLLNNSIFLSSSSTSSIAARDWLFYQDMTIPAKPFNIGLYYSVEALPPHSQNQFLQMTTTFPILLSSFRQLLQLRRYQNSLMLVELLDSFLIEDESYRLPPSSEVDPPPSINNDMLYFSRHHNVIAMSNQISFTTKTATTVPFLATATATSEMIVEVVPSPLEIRGSTSDDNNTTNLEQLSTLHCDRIVDIDNNYAVKLQDNLTTTESLQCDDNAAIVASEAATSLASTTTTSTSSAADSNKPTVTIRIKRQNSLIGPRTSVLPRSEVTRPSKTFVRTSSLRESHDLPTLRLDDKIDNNITSNSIANQRKLHKRSTSISGNSNSTSLVRSDNNNITYERMNARTVSTAAAYPSKNSLISMPRGLTSTSTITSSLSSSSSSFLTRQVAVADTPDQFQKRRSHGIKGRSKTIAKVPTFGETLQF